MHASSIPWNDPSGDRLRTWPEPERKATLTETVRAFEEYLPEHFPLPHPSPRNLLWLRRNPWFERNGLPRLRECLRDALAD